MSSLVIVKSKKTASDILQQTFDLLKNKIADLRMAGKRRRDLLDEYLEYYEKQVHPKRAELVVLWQEEIQLLYRHYKNKNTFSRKERNALREGILGLFKNVFEVGGYSDLDPALSSIFKEFEGITPQDIILRELENLRKKMEEDFARKGMDIDLSDVEINGSQAEILQKLFESIAIQKAAFEEMEKEEPPKVKSKKQIEQDMKKEAIEASEKKGISTIYKQLAKVFHPDLETDQKQKKEKEILMKQLTSAYEKRDLHALLLLEMDWMSKSSDYQKSSNEDQLKIYNRILKEQVGTLKTELEMISEDPKYTSLRCYLDVGIVFGGSILSQESTSLVSLIKQHKNFIQKIQGTNSEKMVRAAIFQHL